ncbi:hypothetical protein HN51_037091 [Arachis hypogaea]|uniref:verprolin-like n=1 Tax=Arachis ipaensis TaxID=130454 RepID=UPI0007AFB9A6|nr:verprolin-like [Arachis ipaensis]XP_025638034.1 verprolin [Arachis hypogaea]QHO02592.1 uncharacterized protein DS421_13g425110 [Arachis hypogaea]
MDSGNSSGSMSSGADEEHESRAHSLSSSYMTPPPPLTTATNNTQQHMFLQDPLLSNYLDIMWSKPNNQSDLASSFIIPSSSQQEQAGGVADVATNQQNQGVPASSPGVNQLPNRAVRNNPKKRSRASRRAPTTVLTTDTSNFRAMVQEFTGIPAPPFPRTRFDLFASSSSSALMDPSPPPPSYLLRPFPQRLLNNHPLPPPSINFQQPISSSSSSSSSLGTLSFQNMLQQAPPPNYPSHHHHAASVAAQVGLRQQAHLNNENRLMSSSSNDSSREEWVQRRSDGQGEALYTDVAENTLLTNTAAKVQQHYSSNTKGTDQCTTQGMLESLIHCSSRHNLRPITQYDEDNNNDIQHKQHY